MITFKLKLPKDSSRILVLREKYGDRYFSCPTVKDVLAVCLGIVRERNETGYYFDYDDEVNPDHEKLLKMALKGDGHAAYNLLRARESYEYEGFDFFSLENL